MPKVPLQFTLNGEEKAEFIDSGITVLRLLRDKVGDLTPKGGCLQGTCGSCTILIDGEPRLACITLAEDCGGADLATVAGLSEGRPPSSAAAGFHRSLRVSVRVLHAGHADGRQGTARPEAESEPGRRGRRAER